MKNRITLSIVALMMTVSLNLINANNTTNLEEEAISNTPPPTNVFYRNIDVYNNYGFNYVDVGLSYNSFNSCSNSYQIRNNTMNNISGLIQIFQDGFLVYQDYFTVFGNHTLNIPNAFSSCNSSMSNMSVVITH